MADHELGLQITSEHWSTPLKQESYHADYNYTSIKRESDAGDGGKLSFCFSNIVGGPVIGGARWPVNINETITISDDEEEPPAIHSTRTQTMITTNTHQKILPALVPAHHDTPLATSSTIFTPQFTFPVSDLVTSQAIVTSCHTTSAVNTPESEMVYLDDQTGDWFKTATTIPQMISPILIKPMKIDSQMTNNTVLTPRTATRLDSGLPLITSCSTVSTSATSEVSTVHTICHVDANASFTVRPVCLCSQQDLQVGTWTDTISSPNTNTIAAIPMAPRYSTLYGNTMENNQRTISEVVTPVESSTPMLPPMFNKPMERMSQCNNTTTNKTSQHDIAITNSIMQHSLHHSIPVAQQTTAMQQIFSRIDTMQPKTSRFNSFTVITPTEVTTLSFSMPAKSAKLQKRKMKTGAETTVTAVNRRPLASARVVPSMNMSRDSLSTVETPSRVTAGKLTFTPGIQWAPKTSVPPNKASIQDLLKTRIIISEDKKALTVFTPEQTVSRIVLPDMITVSEDNKCKYIITKQNIQVIALSEHSMPTIPKTKSPTSQVSTPSVNTLQHNSPPTTISHDDTTSSPTLLEHRIARTDTATVNMSNHIVPEVSKHTRCGVTVPQYTVNNPPSSTTVTKDTPSFSKTRNKPTLTMTMVNPPTPSTAQNKPFTSAITTNELSTSITTKIKPSTADTTKNNPSASATTTTKKKDPTHSITNDKPSNPTKTKCTPLSSIPTQIKRSTSTKTKIPDIAVPVVHQYQVSHSPEAMMMYQNAEESDSRSAPANTASMVVLDDGNSIPEVTLPSVLTQTVPPLSNITHSVTMSSDRLVVKEATVQGNTITMQSVKLKADSRSEDCVQDPSAVEHHWEEKTDTSIKGKQDAGIFARFGNIISRPLIGVNCSGNVKEVIQIDKGDDDAEAPFFNPEKTQTSTDNQTALPLPLHHELPLSTSPTVNASQLTTSTVNQLTTSPPVVTPCHSSTSADTSQGGTAYLDDETGDRISTGAIPQMIPSMSIKPTKLDSECSNKTISTSARSTIDKTVSASTTEMHSSGGTHSTETSDASDSDSSIPPLRQHLYCGTADGHYSLNYDVKEVVSKGKECSISITKYGIRVHKSEVKTAGSEVIYNCRLCFRKYFSIQKFLKHCEGQPHSYNREKQVGVSMLKLSRQKHARSHVKRRITRKKRTGYVSMERKHPKILSSGTEIGTARTSPEGTLPEADPSSMELEQKVPYLRQRLYCGTAEGHYSLNCDISELLPKRACSISITKFGIRLHNSKVRTTGKKLIYDCHLCSHKMYSIDKFVEHCKGQQHRANKGKAASVSMKEYYRQNSAQSQARRCNINQKQLVTQPLLKCASTAKTHPEEDHHALERPVEKPCEEFSEDIEEELEQQSNTTKGPRERPLKLIQRLVCVDRLLSAESNDGSTTGLDSPQMPTLEKINNVESDNQNANSLHGNASAPRKPFKGEAVYTDIPEKSSNCVTSGSEITTSGMTMGTSLMDSSGDDPLDSFSDEQLWKELQQRRYIFECTFMCGLSFKGNTGFCLHRACHSTDNPMRCQYCSFEAKTWMTFHSHFFLH